MEFEVSRFYGYLERETRKQPDDNYTEIFMKYSGSLELLFSEKPPGP